MFRHFAGKFLFRGLTLLFCLPFAVNADKARDDYDSKLANQLFQLCSACHGPDGHGNRELMAPAIAGLPEWYIVNQLRKFKNGGRGAHPADIAGLRMRPMARTLDMGRDKGRNSREVDLHTIAHYVAELKPKQPVDEVKGGDAERGKAFYLVCSACHGPNSEGNQQLNAPSQIYLEDWYMLEQLKKFKRGLRGADAIKDPQGYTMTPIMATIPDEQAMKDVIAYIRQISRESAKKKPEPAATPTGSPAQPE